MLLCACGTPEAHDVAAEDASTGGSSSDVDADAGTSSEGGESTDANATTGEPSLAPEGPLVPPRAATRTCIFGAASGGGSLSGTPGADAFDVPARLSDAHCFSDLPALVPGPDVAAYAINSPLWTDGAHKHRFLVLPPGETIAIEPDGRWAFPVGAAILKVFALERVAGDASSAVPVETRVMIRREIDWAFYTYVWDEDGSDATRVSGGDILLLEQDVDGEPIDLPYYVPHEGDCRICHRWEEEGQVLGPRTPQMSRTFAYADGEKNQIEELALRGWVDTNALADVLDASALVDPSDASADLEARARAYLHANCSHCHREGGWQPIDCDMDLRAEVPLTETRICGVRLQYGSPFAGGEHRIAPGDPEDSNILQRMEMRGEGQMPLFATYAVDPTGVEVLQAWIESLTGCPE